MDSQSKSELFDYLGDDFANTKMSSTTLIELADMIISMILKEKDDAVTEAMLHALIVLAENRNIASKLELTKLTDHYERFGQENTEYIISLLAYTHNTGYEPLIEKLSERYPDIDKAYYLDEISCGDKNER